MKQSRNQRSTDSCCAIVLRGGLGNNLFQIGLAMRLEDSGHSVSFDLSAHRKRRFAVNEIQTLNDFVTLRSLRSTRLLPAPEGVLQYFSWKIRQALV